MLSPDLGTTLPLCCPACGKDVEDVTGLGFTNCDIFLLPAAFSSGHGTTSPSSSAASKHGTAGAAGTQPPQTTITTAHPAAAATAAATAAAAVHERQFDGQPYFVNNDLLCDAVRLHLRFKATKPKAQPQVAKQRPGQQKPAQAANAKHAAAAVSLPRAAPSAASAPLSLQHSSNLGVAA